MRVVETVPTHMAPIAHHHHHQQQQHTQQQQQPQQNFTALQNTPQTHQTPMHHQQLTLPVQSQTILQPTTTSVPFASPEQPSKDTVEVDLFCLLFAHFRSFDFRANSNSSATATATGTATTAVANGFGATATESKSDGTSSADATDSGPTAHSNSKYSTTATAVNTDSHANNGFTDDQYAASNDFDINFAADNIVIDYVVVVKCHLLRAANANHIAVINAKYSRKTSTTRKRAILFSMVESNI